MKWVFCQLVMCLVIVLKGLDECFRQPAQIATFGKSTIAFGDLTDNVCIVDLSTSLVTLNAGMYLS